MTNLFQKAEEASALQLADMARLERVVNSPALGKVAQPPLHAVVQELPLETYASLWRLAVSDGRTTRYVSGGMLFCWAAESLREKGSYIDLAARAVFGKFVPGLGQTLWANKLKAAGFKTGALPREYGT